MCAVCHHPQESHILVAYGCTTECIDCDESVWEVSSEWHDYVDPEEAEVDRFLSSAY